MLGKKEHVQTTNKKNRTEASFGLFRAHAIEILESNEKVHIHIVEMCIRTQ
jgi:hypothetical protein